MEISKLKTLVTPSLNDVLPILDINGGVSGKPILKKATLGSLLALVETDNSSNATTSDFTIPTTIKTIADSGDYFFGVDTSGTPYKITKADLLAGLSTGGSTGGSTSSGSTGDPYFNDVSLLCHFTANTGDIKGNEIIVNGSPTISNNSISFSNNGYLSLNNSANNNNFLLGSSDFTIEFYAYLNDVNIAHSFLAKADYVNALRSYAISYENSGGYKVNFYWSTTGGSPSQLTLSALELQTWNHVAVTRLGNLITGYVNGIYQNSTLFDGSFYQNSTVPLTLGSYANGTQQSNMRMKELRLTKKCRYTSNFTPPQSLPDN